MIPNRLVPKRSQNGSKTGPKRLHSYTYRGEERQKMLYTSFRSFGSQTRMQVILYITVVFTRRGATPDCGRIGLVYSLCMLLHTTVPRPMSWSNSMAFGSETRVQQLSKGSPQVPLSGDYVGVFAGNSPIESYVLGCTRFCPQVGGEQTPLPSLPCGIMYPVLST